MGFSASQELQFIDYMNREFSDDSTRNGLAVSYVKTIQRVEKPVFYSTNPIVSLEISKRYFHGKTNVWCSEIFDPSKEAKNSLSSLIGPTSSPKKIADDLLQEMHDRHSSKIKGYKATYKRLAKLMLARGVISEKESKEIVSIVLQSGDLIWQPVVYVIPRWIVHNSPRLELVPPRARAGAGIEYKINGLELGEFDTIMWA